MNLRERIYAPPAYPRLQRMGPTIKPLPPKCGGVGQVMLMLFLLGSSLVTTANTEPKQNSTEIPELVAKPLGLLTVTSYRSVREQTDSSPYWTSIGVHTNPFIVAVSQDMLRDGRIKYGDTIYIEGFGFKHVADCMAKRHINSLDMWVETKAQEKRIGVRHIRVWKITGILQ